MANKTILLIEDDPNDARLVQRAFEKAEIPAPLTRLKDGDEAVEYLGGAPPYDNRSSYPLPLLLLLDIKLPRRSGFEILSWLRKHPSQLKLLPVIMLTSSRHTSDISRAYELGANSYLKKPDTASELIEMLDAFKRYWLTLNLNPDI